MIMLTDVIDKWAVSLGGLAIYQLRDEASLLCLDWLMKEAARSESVFHFVTWESCQVCECTSRDLSVWHIDRQLVQIKDPQSSERKQLSYWEMHLHGYTRMTTQNKTEPFPLLSHRILSLWGVERIHIQLLKKVHIFLRKVNYKWLQCCLKMWANWEHDLSVTS
jgi:hypothetical protein